MGGPEFNPQNPCKPDMLIVCVCKMGGRQENPWKLVGELGGVYGKKDKTKQEEKQ